MRQKAKQKSRERGQICNQLLVENKLKNIVVVSSGLFTNWILINAFIISGYKSLKIDSKNSSSLASSPGKL